MTKMVTFQPNQLKDRPRDDDAACTVSWRGDVLPAWHGNYVLDLLGGIANCIALAPRTEGL